MRGVHGPGANGLFQALHALGHVRGVQREADDVPHVPGERGQAEEDFDGVTRSFMEPGNWESPVELKN